MKNELLRTLQELKKKMQEAVIDFKDEDYIFILPIDIEIIPVEFLKENSMVIIGVDKKTKVTICGIEYVFNVYSNTILLMNKEEYKKYGLIGLERG